MNTKDKLTAMENMLDRIIGDNLDASTSIGDYIKRVELALRLQENINQIKIENRRKEITI